MFFGMYTKKSKQTVETYTSNDSLRGKIFRENC